MTDVCVDQDKGTSYRMDGFLDIFCQITAPVDGFHFK